MKSQEKEDCQWVRMKRVWHWLENQCETIVSCQNELQNTVLIEGVCQVVQARHDGQDEAESDDGDDGGDGEDDREHDQGRDNLGAVLLPAILQAAHLLVSRGLPLPRHAGLSPSRDISQH